jgi:dTDP-4-amino-4,6-dideoxygalactose transaminase
VRQASDRGKPFFSPAGATNVLASLNLNLGEWGCAVGRVQLRRLSGFVRAGSAVISLLASGIDHVNSISVPPLIPGAEAHYWFLRLLVHEERLRCTKSEFCAALDAEGLPITARYDAALPHEMDWFTQRRVFAHSGLPWTSPQYTGDRNRRFPCPNAHKSLGTHFNLRCHEHWDEDDVTDALAILAKVDAAYALH